METIPWTRDEHARRCAADLVLEQVRMLEKALHYVDEAADVDLNRIALVAALVQARNLVCFFFPSSRSAAKVFADGFLLDAPLTAPARANRPPSPYADLLSDLNKRIAYKLANGGEQLNSNGTWKLAAIAELLDGKLRDFVGQLPPQRAPWFSGARILTPPYRHWPELDSWARNSARS